MQLRMEVRQAERHPASSHIKHTHTGFRISVHSGSTQGQPVSRYRGLEELTGGLEQCHSNKRTGDISQILLSP